MSYMKKEDLKCFYMQVRSDKETREQELGELVRFSGLKEDQITVVNVFDTPIFDGKDADGHHFVFIGGSSDDNDEVAYPPHLLEPVASIEKVLEHTYKESIPTLASCFGFQTAVLQFGGELIYDPEHMEMGSYDISLTDDALRDPLFCDTPNPFHAISGHKKRATKLPKGAVSLASSPLCPIHCMRLSPTFYATQFHSEIDRKGLVDRITRYEKRYPIGDGGLKKICLDCRETPDSNALIGKFIERIVLRN
ncbi:MAG: aminotransferase [Candidatus Vogelbacteria bacterium CG10_big_fil_rev_8_21_14_0_10_45_14]|uniref:Aminotransferase n=1 Tax=Candidatus Vogelbacteria bacterium CG10_big_fil_rev_8_21_14_0_10_45_14 TaxID=1975042 RepID=A0A2H0RKF2_9BACT|nr:MAG: aminotransferase [Candidatus Vogelbacteria bacterium CG10_big_fil_rev_8_21_14_0_10_45_14]